MTHPPYLHIHLPTHHFGMILIEGDTFRMGSDPATDSDADSDEAPAHEVKVDSFYLAPCLVTQQLWKTVMKTDWEHIQFTGHERPMEGVSWDDCKIFIDKLKAQTDLPFRLSTEAEWEYAARGGNLRKDYKFAGSNRIKEAAWYEDNSHSETKPIGRKAANQLGLLDMSGNVWEWCEDDWHSDYENAPENGAWIDHPRGSYRVYRGGGWGLDPQFCRVAARLNWYPDDRHGHLGFRLALSLQ